MLTNPTTTSTQMYPNHSRPSSLNILPPPMTTSTQQLQSHYYPLTTQNNTPTFTTAMLPLLATPSTPIALTPNTMRTIEQSILQTLGEDAEESYMMESQQYSGNFVPPLPSSTSTITLINTWQGGQVCSDGVGAAVEKEEEMQQDQKPVIEEDKLVPQDSNNGNKKKKPARKPTAAAQQSKASKQEPKQTKKAPARKKGASGKTTEEDDRRRIRRERNKLAAARCRKRRVDHTNKLLEETEGLEAKKRALQNQITEMQGVKVDLEFLLENHPCVKTNKIRSEVLADLQNLPRSMSSSNNNSQFIGVKPKRPSTLNVAVSSSGSGESGRGLINVTTPAPPITISTPSNGIAGLGFEPLCPDWNVSTPDGLGGEKGNTPVSVPSSNNNSSNKNNSLVTPVNNPFKKLHDL